MDFTREPQLPQTQPKNWLVESILVTIFCCLPFGIAGIVFAAQVNKLYTSGDYQGAMEASANAAKWTKIGFWIGIISAVIYLAVFFIFGGMAIWNANRNDF